MNHITLIYDSSCYDKLEPFKINGIQENDKRMKSTFWFVIRRQRIYQQRRNKILQIWTKFSFEMMKGHPQSAPSQCKTMQRDYYFISASRKNAAPKNSHVRRMWSNFH